MQRSEERPLRAPTPPGESPTTSVPGGPGRRVWRFGSRVRRSLLRRYRTTARDVDRWYATVRKIGGIQLSLLRAKRFELASRRSYGPADLEWLAGLLGEADAVVPIADAFARAGNRPARLIAPRHDMDHDVENSVRFAKWEAERGFRSTYYVLHGDWYWGGPSAQRPSRFVLKALDRIASLGHEIGLHNNAITIALLTGQDPFAVLERDLKALRRHGFEVRGSVQHGDALCHRVGYVNNELFLDCPLPAGTARNRTITYDDEASGIHRRLPLRARPMAEFGLTHEANYIGQTLYLSDSGGRWSLPPADVERSFVVDGGFLQMLIHPVWWAFSGEMVRPRAIAADPEPAS
jgi:hypothetical protein